MHLTYRVVVLCVHANFTFLRLSAFERSEEDMLNRNDIQVESQRKQIFNVTDYLESIHVDIA